MIPLLEQMRAALDAHDLDAFVEFFREDYIGERPRHPGSPVSSREDVRANWAEVISDVPDLRVEVPAAVQEGNTIWSEWRAYGTARSGAMLELRGVIIFGIEDDRVAWSRMYVEPVEQGLTLDDMAGVGSRKPGRRTRMRRHRKYALWGAAFTSLLALGAVTAAITAGAAPFGAQATTTIVTTITTNSSTVVTTITTTTPDSSSTGSTESSTGSTSTDTTATNTTTTDNSGGGNAGAGGNAPAAKPAKANPNFTG